MRSLSSIPRPVLVALAILFAGTLLVYTAVWLYCVEGSPSADIGVKSKPDYMPYLTIKEVTPGSAADRAGLRANDRILSVDGYRLDGLSLRPFAHGKAGKVVTVVVERPGMAEQLTFQVTLEAAPPPRQHTPAQWLAVTLSLYYQLPFLIVGLSVLFLRLEDRNAWLLALVFAGFIAAGPVSEFAGALSPALWRFMLTYANLLGNSLPAFFYLFFATFPSSSPIDRRWPWLKHFFLVTALAISLPSAALYLVPGSSLLSGSIFHLLEEPLWLVLSGVYSLGGLILGLMSLIWNSLDAPTPDDRRKTQVMVWGTVAGVGPSILLASVGFVQHKVMYEYSFWILAFSILALALMPLSFAYAVVKHRVLEVPVLLRRSARYFLAQRGFLLLILVAGIAVTLLLGHALGHYLPQHQRIGVPVGAGLGVILVLGGAHVQNQVTRRLDRAFFRNAYDTRQILIDLAGKTRSASNREQLAELLRHEIDEALHPSSLAIYFRQSSGDFVTPANVPEEIRRLPGNLPVLEHMRERGQRWEIPPSPVETPSLSILQPLQPECLVPMLGRGGQLLGLAVLGPRMSEEPYSGEDKRLLDSVANQAGSALENIALAESMAERLEAERRAVQEMEIARQVQRKLLPQKAPVLKSLDYAGACIQARAVGGDYYDFLDLGEGRLGFVLADVAGKGISAALLMANLQAHLRSQSALIAQDLPGTLQSVNRLFFESTEPAKYATLFLGLYEDATRRLRYANCGHNPPVLLRADQVETLTSTATVLGMFEDWSCDIAETCLHAGDTLAIFTDGVLEATNSAEEEFGEAGLIAALQASRQLDANALLEAVITAVKQYAPGEQADDLTLLIAKARRN